MAYTQEPRGLAFINNINTNTFGSLVSQFCWLVGSLAFTVVACYLLLDDTGRQADAHHSYGFQLATALLFAWTGKTLAGVADSYGKRTTHPEYVEAMERGKTTGAAAALVLADAAVDVKAARDAKTTSEHPASPVMQVTAEQGSRVETNVQAQPNGTTPVAKAANEPDAYTDDERGDG